MKLPAVHFAIIDAEVSKGIDNADFGKIMSASAALKRFSEENRGLSIEASETDCLVEISNKAMFVHKGDFFGKILSTNETQIFVKEIGKRAFNKAVSDFEKELVTISEIPSDITLAVTI